LRDVDAKQHAIREELLDIRPLRLVVTRSVLTGKDVGVLDDAWLDICRLDVVELEFSLGDAPVLLRLVLLCSCIACATLARR